MRERDIARLQTIGWLLAFYMLIAWSIAPAEEPPVERIEEIALNLPVHVGAIMQMPTEALAQPEPWELWLQETLGASDYTVELAAAISGSEAITGLPEEQRADFAALTCAVLYKESRLRHTENGKVKRGDGGKAIGVGQIHRSPWQKHYSEGLGRDVNLDLLADNVLVCQLLLIRGGWNVLPVKQVASYYNTGRRGASNGYGTLVAELWNEIKESE